MPHPPQPTSADRAMIAPIFLAEALSCLARAGLDPAPVLASAGLDAKAAHTPPQAPPQALAQALAPISAAAFGRLWHATAQAMGDEFFGLGARPMRPGAFAMMGHAVITARDLGQALRRMLRFLNMVLDYPRASLRLRDGMAEIVLEEPEGAPARPAFAYRSYWLIVLGMAAWLVGRGLALQRLECRGQEPPPHPEYRRFFGVPVGFGAPVTRLCLEARHLDLPVRRSPEDLPGFLRRAPGVLLRRYHPQEGMAARVMARLAATAPGQWPDLAGLAQDLGMSGAGLRRRLQAEGQSFAALRAARLSSLARAALAKDPAPRIEDLAHALGYSEAGAFHRAFRGWTGMSPAAFAARARRNSAADRGGCEGGGENGGENGG